MIIWKYELEFCISLKTIRISLTHKHKRNIRTVKTVKVSIVSVEVTWLSPPVFPVYTKFQFCPSQKVPHKLTN